VWEHLPQRLRAQIDSYARARLGILFYLISLPGYVIFKAGSTGPAGFVHAIFSWGFFGAIVLGFGLVLLTVLKGMEIGRKTVPILAQMLPDERDLIAQVYGERGIADVAAPWVKRKIGFVRRTTTKIGGKVIRIFFPVGWRF